MGKSLRKTFHRDGKTEHEKVLRLAHHEGPMWLKPHAKSLHTYLNRYTQKTVKTPNALKDVEKPDHSHKRWCVQPLWKTTWQFLKKHTAICTMP